MGSRRTRTFLSIAESGDAARAAVARLRSAHHAPSLFTMVEGFCPKLRETQLQLLETPTCSQIAS